MPIKDKEIWDIYKRGLAPVAKKKRSLETGKKPIEKVATRSAALSAQKKGPLPRIESRIGQSVFNPLERTREKSLRSGAIEIDAKLDLHGLTQIEAFEALAEFVANKTRAGKRHLLIVTGKGQEGKGVLRTSLEKWLGQLPEAKSILALRMAAPQHGGAGAFYVILRKQKK